MPTNKNLIKIFEYALNQEETGKAFFEQSLQRMGMGAAVSAFKRLIKEEEKHIEFITQILKDLKEGKEINPSGMKQIVLEPTNYFDAREKSEFLQQCIEGSMIPDVTVFNTAWLIEKDLSEFYATMAQNTEGKAKEAFIMLSDWEKEHEKFFKEYRDKLSETYSTMPWGG
ncbi:MAG: ferritin family protein [Deltaproteobacteria bacterium]|nr:ferritin family protein [Deltaproteobacteria bacterium]MBW2001926.1 ferritin family protein [Deltaproteobacteria bacterium]